MTGRRKWAAIPGLVAIAALATALSAYSGATSQTGGGVPQRAQSQPPGGPQQVGAPSPSLEQPVGAAAAPDTGTLGTSTVTQTVAVPDTNPARGPWGYSAASSDQNFSPVQPIRFPHPAHVQKAGMNCVYCHFSANKSPDVGMPAVATCMGCHTMVLPQSPEIKKLAGYYNAADPTKSRPIPWVRIHKVPEYVHFPHMRHVNANVTCQTCHGDVQKMNQVFQYSSLNMGWCINCHIERRARYDCSTCHY